MPNVTFADTNPIEYPIRAGKPYYISAADGNLTVERKKLDGTWIAVDGSPVVDGEEKMLLTYSSGGNIRVTASAAGTEMALEE